MRLLLPPSETKRDGGDGGPVDLELLALPELNDARRELMDEVAALAADHDVAMRALKLGPRQSAEVERNRRLHDAPSMPAIDRYTGVLFDALDARTLSAEARSYAADTVMVHSALFGLIGALERRESSAHHRAGIDVRAGRSPTPATRGCTSRPC